MEARKAQAVLQNAAACLYFQFSFHWKHFHKTFFVYLFYPCPRQPPKHTILQLCWILICENTVEDLMWNSEFAEGVFRNMRQIDQTLAAELSKQWAAVMASIRNMTHVHQSSLHWTYKYSIKSLHMHSEEIIAFWILISRDLRPIFLCFQDMISR